ncbi:hypothetical protein CPB86DRAFT_753787 [Serendipita vermifera]|nr:hypothetical protein CPB86DRAFT_753787 [Serendipita vermifera]
MQRPDNNALRLVSFDGGGPQCLAQLYVLKEIMQRIQYDQNEEILPADYFDLMAGSELGGLIVVLLVVLRFSVDKAIEKFRKVAQKAYLVQGLTAFQRTAALRSELEDILHETRLEKDVLLLDLSRPAQRCQGFLTTVLSTGVNTCFKLRTYISREASGLPVSIVDAVLASCASHPLHTIATIDGMTVVGGNLGFSNPTKELLTEALHLYGKDAHVSSVISLGLGRPPPMAFPTAEIHQQEQWNRFLLQIVTDGESVSRELLARVYHLGIYFRFSTPNTSFGHHANYNSHGGSEFENIHTYIADSSPNLDHCVSVLKNSLGVVTLDQLNRTPGGMTVIKTLPPLTTHFIMREDPWKALVNGLLSPPQYGMAHEQQRIMVISGMGGCGKTQLALKFAHEHQEIYKHVFFIDASSEANIKADLVANVRSLGAEYSQESFEGAMGLLQGLFKDWLLIYDNVDDPSLDLVDLLPQCTHGSIIITTRNPSLGDLCSSTPLEMDVMSEEEAVAALLSAAVPKPKKPTMDEVAMSIRIVEELGYLPVAIIQAGSFIRQRKCFPDYLNRLRANRLKLLQTPATAQRDRHSHSVYATLETTKLALPRPVIQLLHLLSYYHHSNILVNGMTLAAERSFAHQTFNFLERPIAFHQSIALLKDIFWTREVWDSEEFDDNLLLLQKYSLITTVRNEGKLIIRLHPLTRAWARDMLEVGKTKLYEEAAVRILMCCASYFMERDQPSFVLQITSIQQSITHVNDRAILAYARTFSSPLQAIVLWTSVMQEVVAYFPGDHEYIAEILYWIGMAHERAGRHKEALKLNERAMHMLSRLLGPQHPRTLKAMTQVAWTYIEMERVADAEVLLDQVIETGNQILGEENDILTSAMHCLGQVYSRQERLAEAESLQRNLLNLLTTCEGPKHPVTLAAMTNLAATLFRQGRHEKALAMEETILELKKEVFGMEHPSIATTMFNFACLKYDLGQLEEANLLATKSRDIRKKVLGEEHEFYKSTVELCNTISKAMATRALGNDMNGIKQPLLQSSSLMNSTRELLLQGSLELEEHVTTDGQTMLDESVPLHRQMSLPRPWADKSPQPQLQHLALLEAQMRRAYSMAEQRHSHPLPGYQQPYEPPLPAARQQSQQQQYVRPWNDLPSRGAYPSSTYWQFQQPFSLGNATQRSINPAQISMGSNNRVPTPPRNNPHPQGYYPIPMAQQQPYIRPWNDTPLHGAYSLSAQTSMGSIGAPFSPRTNPHPQGYYPPPAYPQPHDPPSMNDFSMGASTNGPPVRPWNELHAQPAQRPPPRHIPNVREIRPWGDSYYPPAYNQPQERPYSSNTIPAPFKPSSNDTSMGSSTHSGYSQAYPARPWSESTSPELLDLLSPGLNMQLPQETPWEDKVGGGETAHHRSGSSSSKFLSLFQHNKDASR